MSDAGCQSGSPVRCSASGAIASAGQAQRGDRLRRDAFTAAGEAELLRGRRLDADAARLDRENFGDARHHGVALRPYLGTLADERDVDMRDDPAGRGDEVGGVAEKAMRRRAAPLRVAGREMHADIAGAERAEDG